MIDPVLVGALSIPLLLILLFLRVHVGIALYATGFLGYWAMTGNFGNAIRILATQPYAVTASFTMAALPLFMMMGVVAGLCGFAEDAYDTGMLWLGKFRGGLAISTTFANAMFGAACGATTAAVAVFTQFSLPQMRKHGYDPIFATASIAAAGALAMLIPPSVLMIVFGVLTEQSIGKLFIAGIGPGLVLTTCLVIGVSVMVHLNPALAPPVKMDISWRQRLASLRQIWGVVLLALIILGGIYSGVFTPEESGAVGTLAAMIVAISLKRMDSKSFQSVLADAARVNAMVFILFSGATLFGRMMALSTLPTTLVNWVVEGGFPPYVFMAVLMVMYLVMGCLMDSISMMTLTLPIVFPIALAMHWNPFWFATIVVVNMEVGLLTPPFGLSVFVAKAVAGPDVTLEALFRAIVPFILMTMAALMIVILFPPISTYLPALMSR